MLSALEHLSGHLTFSGVNADSAARKAGEGTVAT
jgi:hypothetical protein